MILQRDSFGLPRAYYIKDMGSMIRKQLICSGHIFQATCPFELQKQLYEGVHIIFSMTPIGAIMGQF